MDQKKSLCQPILITGPSITWFEKWNYNSPPPPFSKIKNQNLIWLIWLKFNCKDNFLYFSDWWAFAQAASCFGFFGILVSFFLVILYLFVDTCKGNGEVATGAAILCLVTGNLMAMTSGSMIILTLPSRPLPLSPQTHRLLISVWHYRLSYFQF